MKAMSWMRTRPRSLAAGALVTAAALGVTTMAVAYEGNPTTELDLHDGSVWITKTDDQLLGHFNAESKVLDGRLAAGSAQYDVLQDGEDVLVHDQSGSTLARVEPAGLTLGDRADLPPGALVDFAAQTVAVLDPAAGALFVLPLQGASAFEPAKAEPVLELGEGAAVTVAHDGTVLAASPQNAAVYSVRLDPDGTPGEPAERTIDGVDEKSVLEITSVRDQAVVLDRTEGGLILPGGQRVEIDGAAEAQLAQDARDGDAVIVATGDGLRQVPLDGSAPVELAQPEAAGTPVAPVWLNGCAYGAWMGSGSFVRDCAGAAYDQVSAIDEYQAAGELRFRVNRDVVLLNDMLTGGAWLASEQLQKVDNWDKLTPPQGEGVEDQEQVTEQVPDPVLPDRTKENRPPVAENDTYGVRAGRTAVIPVLLNDSDPDGDVLTVTLPEDDPSLGALELVQNGAAIQIDVDPDARGAGSFRYTAEDGRGGTAEATVNLSVRGEDENVGPEQKRNVAIPVESGSTVTYNVLPDWVDLDGDTAYLESVIPLPGDEVDFTPDGRVTYRAISGAQGPAEVAVFVTDGTATTAGVLKLDVRPPGSTVPITTADHVTTQVGREVTVSPLANDLSASEDPLRLTRVDEVDGARVVPDFQAKTFQFSSDVADTYYVQYLASTGPNAVPGLVRIDVEPPVDEEVPPVAVRDIALMPAGGDALIDVLANDVDPGGGVLVVQSVDAEQGSGVSVSVLNHETLRISDRAVLGEQATIRYTVSNGYASAQGEVIVIPVPAPDKLRPPVANDDEAVVRAGDLVTIPVLENDYHPNDDEMSVLPELIDPPDEADGEMFVAEDTVRFKAGSQPGTVYGTYEVADSTGQKDAGYITIQILPVDEEDNAAPRPRDITARALAGTASPVTVPVNGIDPDGDSVELVGLASAPSKGMLVGLAADSFVYQPYADAAGVDTFSYRVRDALGAEGTASVRVGIAPETTKNQAPYAVRDSLAVRPGRVVAVPVTANDSDPDGDSFGLSSGDDTLVLPEDGSLRARVINTDRIEITAPDEETQTSLQYTIVDERGANAQGVLQVTVDEDVPLQMPIARDDRIDVQQVDEDLVAEVDIFANDEDPDGTMDAVELAIDADEGVTRGEAGALSVQLTDERRLIGYAVTDEDGQTARAFLHVPAIGDIGPSLITASPVEVDSGVRTELPLTDHVWVPGGGGVRITEAAKVVAGHGNGDGLVLDATTLVYTSADRYAGADAITFEVTTGDGPDDPEGQKATLTLPLTVRPPANQQPMFTGADLQVGAGDDPSTLDLAALASDIDEDELSFQVAGAPAGIDAAVDGGTLTVGAAADQKGATAQLQITVSDGETEPVTGVVDVLVTSSSRELPTVTDDTIEQADQGETISVPVLANDVSPFPDAPLELVSATVEAGQGDATVAGDQVSVTPGADFHGRMVVRYRVQDKTEDQDRMVEGRVYVTVQGVPDAPGRPTVTSVQDRTVAMSWTPPADNGAPIEHYLVTSTAGDYEKTCASTTCTLDGLTNNVEYNFTVVAVNRVGPSEPSLASETARPDVRPDTPIAPTVPAFGDGQLTVAWKTPGTSGSPVSSYTLQISPAAPNGVSQIEVEGGGTTRYVWEGLANGTAYQFQVQAHNAAPDPSSWSPWSMTEIPAAPPAAPAQPTTQRLDPVGDQAQLQVSWNAPAAGGDPIRGYALDVLKGGTVSETIPVGAGTVSQAVSVPADSGDYTFRVRAENKAGWGENSAPSAPRQAFGVPGAPLSVTASTPTNDSRIHVSWQPGDLNGARAGQVSYQYSLNGGDWAGAGTGTSTTVPASNGQEFTVRIRAITTADGATYTGEPTQSNAATSYGPLPAPNVTATVTGDGTQIRFRWSASGNGRPITVSVSGAVSSSAASGDVTYDHGHSETRQITVTVTDTAGQRVSGSASAKTDPPPNPSASLSHGGQTGGVSGCNSANCQYVKVNYADFPNKSYTFTLQSKGADGTGSWQDSGCANTARLSGSGSHTTSCFFGYYGDPVRMHIRSGDGSVDFYATNNSW